MYRLDWLFLEMELLLGMLYLCYMSRALGSSHASQVHLQTVIIELACKLVVVLGNGLTCCGSTLAEHCWQVRLLPIDLHLAAGFAKVALKSVWVDDLLHLLSLLIDEVVGGDKVSLLKHILSLAMAKHDMALDTTLWMLIGLHILLEFTLINDHLFCLGGVFIGCS